MILLIAIILFIILVLCQVRKKDRQEGYGYTVNDYSVQWSNKAGIENNVQKWIFVFVNKKGETYHRKQFEKGVDPDTMFKNFTTVDNTKLIDNKTFDVDISGTNKLKIYYNTEDTNNFITEKEFVYDDFGIALSDVQFTVPPPEKAYYSWKYYKKQIKGVSQLKDLVPDNSGTVETLGPIFSSDPINDFIYSNDFDYYSEGTLYYEGHFYANQVINLFSFINYQIKSDNDFMKIYIDGKLQLNIDSDADLLWITTREDELNYTFIKDQTHKIQIITTSEKSMYLFFKSNELVNVLENEMYFTKKKFKYNDPVNIPEDAVGEIIEPETEIDRTGEFVWQLFEDNGYLADVSSFLDLTPTKTGLTKTIKNKTDGTGGTLLNNNDKDNYGVKWTGYFVPKKSGYHHFKTESSDMSYLYIDGFKVVDNGGLHGVQSRYGYIYLEKDKTHKLEIYFSENTGFDEIIVNFFEPFSSSWKDTFDGYLTPFDYEPLLKVSIIVEPEPEPETEIDRTGEFVWQLFEDNGYLADVSSFLDLTPNKTGVTKTIKNKTYGTDGTLLNNSYKDNYGVKWTGYFVPKTTGNHEFNTRSDDMSYLYIDGVKVVDNGGLHGMVSKSGYVTLEKNKIYKLEIYFSEKGGGDDIIVKFREPFSLTWKDTFDGYLTSFDNVFVSKESLPVKCEGFYDENWSDCSVTCGGGTKTKKWNTTVSPENGGDVCPPSTITQSCNTQSCKSCKEHDQYLNWQSGGVDVVDPTTGKKCSDYTDEEECNDTAKRISYHEWIEVCEWK